MAQTKKSTSQKQKGKKKAPAKKSMKNSLFSSEHKQITALVSFFFSLFMAAVVFIDAGSVWGAL